MTKDFYEMTLDEIAEAYPDMSVSEIKEKRPELFAAVEESTFQTIVEGDEPMKWVPDPEDDSEEAFRVAYEKENDVGDVEEQANTEWKSVIAEKFINEAKAKGNLGQGGWKKKLAEGFAQKAGLDPGMIKEHLRTEEKPISERTSPPTSPRRKEPKKIYRRGFYTSEPKSTVNPGGLPFMEKLAGKRPLTFDPRDDLKDRLARQGVILSKPKEDGPTFQESHRKATERRLQELREEREKAFKELAEKGR